MKGFSYNAHCLLLYLHLTIASLNFLYYCLNESFLFWKVIFREECCKQEEERDGDLSQWISSSSAFFEDSFFLSFSYVYFFIELSALENIYTKIWLFKWLWSENLRFLTFYTFLCKFQPISFLKIKFLWCRNTHLDFLFDAYVWNDFHFRNLLFNIKIYEQAQLKILIVLVLTNCQQLS